MWESQRSTVKEKNIFPAAEDKEYYFIRNNTG